MFWFDGKLFRRCEGGDGDRSKNVPPIAGGGVGGAGAARPATAVPTSSSSWRTTWASPTSAATGRRSPRRTSTAWRGAAPLHAFLQRGALLPDAVRPADRALQPPGRRRQHGEGHGRAGIPGLPQRSLRDVRRSAAPGRLSRADGREMARRRGASALADRPRLRAVFRADQRRLATTGASTPGGRWRSTSEPYTPEPGKFYMTDAFTDHAVKLIGEYGPQAGTVLPVPGLHRAALAAARLAGGHREVSRQVPQGLGRAARASGTSGRSRWAIVERRSGP